MRVRSAILGGNAPIGSETSLLKGGIAALAHRSAQRGNYGKFAVVEFMSETCVYIEDMIHGVVGREFDFDFD